MEEQDVSARAADAWSGGIDVPRPRADRGGMSAVDLLAFRRAVNAATRRAFVTPMLVLACAAAFAAMIATGVPILWPSAPELVRWGANDGARLILRHEYWRLVASVFVHGGLIHLVVNMWSLLVIGPLVERIYGHLAFAVLYLAAGVGGAIASAAVPPMRVSVGASGAICGVLGGLLAFLLVHRHTIPLTVLRQLRKSVLGVVLFMAVLGAVVSNIDQAAHLGGLATGFVCGLLLIGPWPVAPGPRRGILARRISVTAAIIAGLAGASVAVANRGDAIVPPDRRLDDLTGQLAPVIREFNAIRKDLSRAIGRENANAAPSENQAALADLRILRARAVANAARLETIRTTQRELREIRDSVAHALSSQLDRIDALSRYAETGDPAELDAARDALASAAEATRECEEHRRRYVARYGLILRDLTGHPVR
jgi:rhomboid protease GluP